MKPLYLFLDLWAIIRLFEGEACAQLWERLILLSNQGCCVLVLSIWHIHEMLRDNNQARARKLCQSLNALSKETPSVWIRLRTEIQAEEISKLFFKSQGAAFNATGPFCSEPVALFPNYEVVLCGTYTAPRPPMVLG